jgi:sec-independent protein translocase protein TatA
VGRIEELVLIILIAIVLFGGKKLSAVGKGLGEGVRNFRDALKADSPPPKKDPPTNSGQ